MPRLLRCFLLAGIATGLVAAQSASGTLAISGDIATPLTLKPDDLGKMPREKVSVTDQDGTKASSCAKF
jgi:hypothetical protein